MGRLYAATSLAFIIVWVLVVAAVWWPGLTSEHATQPPVETTQPVSVPEATRSFLHDYGALLIGVGSLIASGFLVANQIAVRQLQAQILGQQRATSELQARTLALSERAQDWNERRLAPIPVLLPVRCMRLASGPAFRISLDVSNPGDVPLFIVSMFFVATDAKGQKLFEVKGEPERIGGDASPWQSMRVDAHAVRTFGLGAQTHVARQMITPVSLDMALTFVAGDRGGVLNCSTFRVKELDSAELKKLGNWDQGWQFAAGRSELDFTGLELASTPPQS
jgi:hypothetical protein